jgi:hypothetical protein
MKNFLAALILTAGITTWVHAAPTTYVQNRATLQTGTTIYVSSGTVNSLTALTVAASTVTITTNLKDSALSTGTSGYAFTSRGANLGPQWLPPAAAGGSSGQIQYNNAGVFAGLPSFVTVSSVTISTPTAHLGGTTAAVAGYNGEIIECSCSTSGASAFNCCTLSLTAGDWLILGGGTTAGASTVQIGISTVTASFTGTTVGGSNNTGGCDAGTGSGEAHAFRRLLLTGSQSVFLVGNTSPGTRTVNGQASATRIGH